MIVRLFHRSEVLGVIYSDGELVGPSYWTRKPEEGPTLSVDLPHSILHVSVNDQWVDIETANRLTGRKWTIHAWLEQEARVLVNETLTLNFYPSWGEKVLLEATLRGHSGAWTLRSKLKTGEVLLFCDKECTDSYSSALGDLGFEFMATFDTWAQATEGLASVKKAMAEGACSLDWQIANHLAANPPELIWGVQEKAAPVLPSSAPELLCLLNGRVDDQLLADKALKQLKGFTIIFPYDDDMCLIGEVSGKLPIFGGAHITQTGVFNNKEWESATQPGYTIGWRENTYGEVRLELPEGAPCWPFKVYKERHTEDAECSHGLLLAMTGW